ncbi:permease of the major facilitator superfamily [Hypoxylon trugodes]|uniref:permease of the major facilitator superfamily n=1 Tax=Hypoxylon trugodes TaxID=326681 RepID=UPI00219F3A51|nr:permease of the major facilitator superfamily [Hypoxylon trugodes]KAI1386033.1 permease of the major facilitator superfamily [Hypoxylon trugodes]
MCTINLSTLIASLDLGIVATAIPAITDEFHVLNDIGWYSGACFILVGATSAMWGKLFTYCPAQLVYMVSLFIYMVGSVVAAAAPNSPALITGRALQGVGCSGTLSGSVILINYTAAPPKRPILIGAWMGVFMIATILGPLLGGVFTTEVTWRWCFWINLPVGGLALVMQMFFLRIPKHIKPVSATWREILLHLDFPGFSILLCSLICYTLALQWGGLSDGNVIATLVMFGVLAISFFVCEYFQGRYAMIPLDLFKPRAIWSQTVFAYMYNCPSFLILFNLPIYFQSVKGITAIMSGVYQLPYVAFFALGSMISGGIIGTTRHIMPVELVGALVATLGAALVYTLNADSSKAWYVGAQIPLGIGLGLGSQVPVTALQGFSKTEFAGVMTGGLFVCQTISGGYFTTAANSILENLILANLAREAPEIDTQKVLAVGASEIWSNFNGTQLTDVINAYMEGIKGVFAFILGSTAFTVVLALIIPIEKLPNHDSEKTQTEVSTDNEKVII